MNSDDFWLDIPFKPSPTGGGGCVEEEEESLLVLDDLEEELGRGAGPGIVSTSIKGKWERAFMTKA